MPAVLADPLLDACAVVCLVAHLVCLVCVFALLVYFGFCAGWSRFFDCLVVSCFDCLFVWLVGWLFVVVVVVCLYLFACVRVWLCCFVFP